MTDKELLTLAAKAAGVEITWEHGQDYPERLELFRGHLQNYERWDPLNDDGDALRLAVKLGIDLSFEGDNVVFADGNCSEFLRDDYCVATRRAITRAAASIGAKAPSMQLTQAGHAVMQEAVMDNAEIVSHGRLAEGDTHADTR